MNRLDRSPSLARGFGQAGLSAHVLRKALFTPILQPTVRDFDCGDAPWEREVSDWIKNDAQNDIAKFKTQVWIYYLQGTKDVIGLGSLGPSRWEWPNPGSVRQALSIIPYVAVQRRYWGQPSLQGAHKYSSQILDDLLSEARLHTDRMPVVGLMVHPENDRARAWYVREHFEEYPTPYVDKASGTAYRRMFRRL